MNEQPTRNATPVDLLAEGIRRLTNTSAEPIRCEIEEIIKKNQCYETEFYDKLLKNLNLEVRRLRKENEMLQVQVRMFAEYEYLKQKELERTCEECL